MLLRSTLIYAPAILLTRISALLLLAIATRLIDQTEYGLLTLVVTIGEMTDVAVTNWLRISLLRLGGKGEISRGSLVLAGRVLLVTTAAGAGGVGWPPRCWWCRSAGSNSPWRSRPIWWRARSAALR